MLKKVTCLLLVVLFSALVFGDKPEKPETIAVVGSSVATGWVSTHKYPMDNRAGWAYRLNRELIDKGFSVVNLGIPGDTTKHVLTRLEEDVLSLQPDYVIISLSLENEGIRKENPDKIFKQFEDNLRKIISICREANIKPVVGYCYANNQFDVKTYDYIRKMNGLIDKLDVPSINFLGALNDKSGRFPKGYNFDFDHPNTLGHLEFSTSIVPTLFEALRNGKVMPERIQSPSSLNFGDESANKYLSYVPDSPVHSFTIRLNLKVTSDGDLITVKGMKESINLKYQSGQLIYNGKIPVAKLKAGEWTDLTIVQNYALEEFEVFSGNTLLKSIKRHIEPLEYIIGSREKKGAGFELKEIFLYRAALTPGQIEELGTNSIVRASMEIYSTGRILKRDGVASLVNNAQSMSRFYLNNYEQARIPTLRKKYHVLFLEREKVRKALAGKPVIEIEELKPLTGKYKVNDSFIVDVIIKDGGLFVNDPRGSLIELEPVKDRLFKMKIPSVDIKLEFIPDAEGKITLLKIHDSQGTLEAPRIEEQESQ